MNDSLLDLTSHRMLLVVIVSEKTKISKVYQASNF
jgi:hypothetical protein